MTLPAAATSLAGIVAGIVAGIGAGSGAGLSAGAGIGIDVVEVLRGSTAGPLLVAAGAVGGAAAGAVMVTVAAWLVIGRRSAGAGAGAGARDGNRDVTRALRVAVVVSLLGTGAEVVLLLLDGARPGERWLTVALARLLLLLVFVEGSGSRLARDVLVLPLLATALLGAPLASGASGTGTVLVAAAVALVAAVTALWVTASPPRRAARPAPAGPRPEPSVAAAAGGQARRSLVVTVGSLAVIAALLATLSAPDPVPPHHQQRIVVDGLTFDVTVAPARPGPNEAHLYAFDPMGSPAPVDDVRVEVVGAPATAHELFEVSPDHHLTYALELPDTATWRIVFQASGEDGQRRRLHLDIDR